MPAPTDDGPEGRSHALKGALEQDPPYGAEVTFTAEKGDRRVGRAAARVMARRSDAARITPFFGKDAM